MSTVSSEEDYSDEEDSFLWKKKEIKDIKQQRHPKTNLSLILYYKGRTKKGQTSESDVSDTCLSPVKNNPPRTFDAEMHRPFGPTDCHN